MEGHPLDPFLDDWANACGRDGVEVRLRVYRALDAPGPWSRVRLRVTLRALLVLDPSERAEFDARFDDTFSDEPAWTRVLSSQPGWDQALALGELRSAQPEAPVTEPLPATAEPLPASPPTERDPEVTEQPSAESDTDSSLLSSRVALALLIAVFCALVWNEWRPSTTPTPPAHVTSDAAAPAPVDASTLRRTEIPSDGGLSVVERDDPPDPLRPPELIAVTMRDAAQPWWRRALRHAGFSLLGAVLLWEVMLLYDLLTRWSASKPVHLAKTETVKVREDTPRERLFDRKAPFELAPPLDAQELDALAWAMGFSDDEARPVFDVAASVAATARAGGMLDPVFAPGRHASSLCVVRPVAVEPVAEALLTCFVDGMRARGVTVEITTRDDAPPADVTLVFVDSDAPQRSHVGAWVRRPAVAFVELRDPGLWGPEVRALPKAPFVFDAAGLGAALDAARGEAAPRTAPTEARGNDRQRLGRAMRLAVACSLCDGFDLAIADALRRAFAPELGFLSLQRVLGLHGVEGDAVSGWSMAPSLTRWLQAPQRCRPKFERAVLQWQRARIAQTPAPPGSRAEALRTQELAWLDLRLGEIRDPSTLGQWLAVIERHAKHPKLGRVVEQERKRALRRGPLALPTLGRSLEERTLQERLAVQGMGERDPVTLAWPKRRPKLLTEGANAVVALGCAAYAAVALEEPRTEVWSGVRSREVGAIEGRAFARECPPRLFVIRHASVGMGLPAALICGATGSDAHGVALSLSRDSGIRPAELSCSHGALTGLRGRKLFNAQGALTEIKVTGVVCPGDTSGVGERLNADEDLVFDCGANAVLAGIHGHESDDGRTLLGLGVICRMVVERGAR